MADASCRRPSIGSHLVISFWMGDFMAQFVFVRFHLGSCLMDEVGAKYKHEKTWPRNWDFLWFWGPGGCIVWPLWAPNFVPKPPGDPIVARRAILGSPGGPGLDLEWFWGTFGRHFGRSISKFFVKQLILGGFFWELSSDVSWGGFLVAFTSMAWSPET